MRLTEHVHHFDSQRIIGLALEADTFEEERILTALSKTFRAKGTITLVRQAASEDEEIEFTFKLESREGGK